VVRETCTTASTWRPHATAGVHLASATRAISLQSRSYYNFNSLVSFGVEQSMYRTRASNNSAGDAGGLFLLRDILSRQWHDIRTEIGPIFTF
jgi:hypothetical protein